MSTTPPPPSQEPTWYYLEGQQRLGPIPTQTMLTLIESGGITAGTMVWRQGMETWAPIGGVAEFAFAFTGPSPATQEKSQKKLVAGLLGILLGSLGIHKFYLGYNTEGLVMLLVSLLGGFATCGLAWSAMHVIGLIEGILYLTKGDEEFARVYVRGRKGWF